MIYLEYGWGINKLKSSLMESHPAEVRDIICQKRATYKFLDFIYALMRSSLYLKITSCVTNPISVVHNLQIRIVVAQAGEFTIVILTM